MKSSVFKLAHSIKAQFSSWSEALVEAWKQIKELASKAKTLRTRLSKHIVHFTFIKKNGEVREAFGYNKIAPASKGTSRKSPWYIVKFFCTDKNAWRSCDVRTIQEIY